MIAAFDDVYPIVPVPRHGLPLDKQDIPAFYERLHASAAGDKRAIGSRPLYNIFLHFDFFQRLAPVSNTRRVWLICLKIPD